LSKSGETDSLDVQELKRVHDVGKLIAIYRNKRDTRSDEARDSLIEIGEPAAAAIQSWLLDKSASDRLQAAYLLVDICGPKAIEPLASVMLDKEDDIMVRDFMPYILGNLGDIKAVTPLSQLILDEDESEMLRVFAGAHLETLLPWEKIDPRVREVITEIGPTEFKAIVPVTNRQDLQKMLEDGTYRYPLYAFLLYTEVDKTFARFVNTKGRWLHELSGEECLIGTVENPKKWGGGWQNYWKEKLGTDFDLKMMKWMELTPVDRDIAFGLAEELHVDKNLLPCIVFVDPDSIHEVLSIPVIADTAEYADFFKDLFTAVQRASKVKEGQKVRDLKKAWLKYWLKWSAHQKAKLLQGKMKKWGSILVEFDETTSILSILAKYLPLIAALLSIR
jgi:hypothetical protein